MSIEDYKFYDDDFSYCHSTVLEVYYDVALDCSTLMICKNDVIALAKHFKLNAHDIGCSEFKALSKDYNKLEDELMAIQATINNTSKRLQ